VNIATIAFLGDTIWQLKCDNEQLVYFFLYM